jgi:serine/threonine protein phosphatase 1
MSGRTFAIGDIHGDLRQLKQLIRRLPDLRSEDTLVFLGDYVDRGPRSAQVIDFIRHELPESTDAKIVCLRGNHEDAWLRVIRQGWDAFVLPPTNGCLAALRSFTGGPVPAAKERPTDPDEWKAMTTGSFFPEDVVTWMNNLPYFYEDHHAIYVHAGLPLDDDGGFPHPSQVENPVVLLWLRTQEFFRDYRGKTVVFGHTVTSTLPEELSNYTPDDPTDLWAGENVIGIDTGCGKGGFLTAIEFPDLVVWESRTSKQRAETARRFRESRTDTDIGENNDLDITDA